MLELKIKKQSDINYFKIDLLDAENGIQLNKSIKEISSPDKYNINYSNSFKIVLNENITKLLEYKNIKNNSSISYDAIISDDEFEIISGIISFSTIDETINGMEILNATFYSKGSDFFDNLKTKYLSDLSIIGGQLIYDNVWNIESYSPYNDTSPYFYGIVDNGQINHTALNGGVRGVNERFNLNAYGVGYPTDYSMNDIYPSAKINYIWKKIHEEAGYTWNDDSDFFQTEQWRKLLLNDWNNFKHTKEEIDLFKSKAKFENEKQGYAPNEDFIENVIFPVTFSEYSGDFSATNFNPNENRLMKSSISVDIEIELSDLLLEYSPGDDVSNIPVRANSRFKIFIYLKANNSTNGEVVNIDNSLFTFEIGRRLGNVVDLEKKVSLKFKTDLDYNQFIKEGNYKLMVNVLPYDYFQNAINDADYITDFYKVKVKGSLSFEPHEKIAPGETFLFKNVVPKMKQIDLIKNIAQLFNLRFVFDENRNHIDWYTFDEYYLRDSEIKDYTNKIDITKIKKTLGEKWQASESLFSFETMDGNNIENYNSNNDINYGTKLFKNPGNLSKQKFEYKNKFGIQPYNIINDLFITNNNNYDEIIKSGTIYRNMNKKPYLSFMNMMQSDVPLIFRKENLDRDFPNGSYDFPTSTHIMNPKKTGVSGDITTLELSNSNNTDIGWRAPNLNFYDLFLGTDFNDVFGFTSEKLECQLLLNNYEYTKLKLNDIIQYKDFVYRIDGIKNFNENNLTKLDLIKISFNPNYDGTTYSSISWILPFPFNNNLGIIIMNDGDVYNSGVHSFNVDWDNLDDNLILTNSTDSNTDKYEFSYDGVTWFSIPVGDSINFSIISAGSQTFYYKIVNGNGSSYDGTNHTCFLDLKSDYATTGLIERVTISTVLKTTLNIAVGSVDGVPLDNEPNINQGETTYAEKITTNLL